MPVPCHSPSSKLSHGGIRFQHQDVLALPVQSVAMLTVCVDLPTPLFRWPITIITVIRVPYLEPEHPAGWRAWPRCLGSTPRPYIKDAPCLLCGPPPPPHAQRVATAVCAHPVHGRIRFLRTLPAAGPHLYASSLHRAEDRRTMNEQPRPRANNWQIAGVWISAAALLIAVARAAIDLWSLFR